MSKEFDLAQAVLDTVGAWFDDVDDHPDLAEDGRPLPERRLICIGLPAADCESLQVSIESVVPITGNVQNLGTAIDTDEVTFHMRAVNLGIWLMRCVPGLDGDGNPPPPEDETASAFAVTDDRAQIEAALHEAYTEGELPGCGGIAFVEWQSITPEGYIGGGVLRLIMSLE